MQGVGLGNFTSTGASSTAQKSSTKVNGTDTPSINASSVGNVAQKKVRASLSLSFFFFMTLPFSNYISVCLNKPSFY